jgi:hypothetical protein
MTFQARRQLLINLVEEFFWREKYAGQRLKLETNFQHCGRAGAGGQHSLWKNRCKKIAVVESANDIASRELFPPFHLLIEES